MMEKEGKETTLLHFSSPIFDSNFLFYHICTTTQKRKMKYEETETMFKEKLDTINGLARKVHFELFQNNWLN